MRIATTFFILVIVGTCSSFVPLQWSARTTSMLSAKKEEEKVSGHDTGGAAATLPPKVQAQMEAYREHQQNAPKLDFAADVRSLVQYNHGFAVLSTHSVDTPEYPGGSVVGFAPDSAGQALFCFSGMSGHTTDLLANPHCSLTVAAKQFKGAADGRVNLRGKAVKLTEKAEIEEVREIYMKKHPGAFWTSFGDFSWFRMSVDHVRFVGGFARAGSVSAAEYGASAPDSVAEFGPAIAQHMNEDHKEANIAIVRGSVPGMLDGPTIEDAEITSVDTLGMYVKVSRESAVEFLPQSFKCRVPFPRPATDRKDVRTLIVEMTQAAAAPE